MRYCEFLGCSNKIEVGKYCEEHRRKKKKKKYVKKYQSKNKAFYDSDEWKALRSDVLIRDRYRCVHCGKAVFGKQAQVHHIIPIWKNEGLKLDDKNCETVCAKCHTKVEMKR